MKYIFILCLLATGLHAEYKIDDWVILKEDSNNTWTSTSFKAGSYKVVGVEDFFGIQKISIMYPPNPEVTYIVPSFDMYKVEPYQPHKYINIIQGLGFLAGITIVSIFALGFMTKTF